MEPQKPSETRKDLDVEFAEENRSLISEAFQRMYSQIGLTEEEQQRVEHVEKREER